MKLTKQNEEEVKEVVDTYWANYIKGDVDGIASLLDDQYSQVGSADTEVFFNKKDAVKFLHHTIEQVAGKVEMKNRITKIEPLDDFILVSDFCDLYVLNEIEWIFYSKFRASTILHKKSGSWKIVHQHSSFPDTKTGDGDNISIEAIATENLQLKEAVRRRTVELEQKNRELEIESSLERVRSAAMAMHKSDDLPNVCERMYREFLALGFSDLRNAIINIYNDTDGSFINYDYADAVGKSSHRFTNDILPFVDKLIKTSKSADDAFAESYITGKALAEFKSLRRQTGQKDDPRLNDAESLHFYFYSIGTGTIGISTFAKITEDNKSILKLFRNVFNLSYQRYVDISKAEEQARESQIQLALERVRARTMAMQHSDELQEVAIMLFDQMKGLGIATGSCGFNIWDKKDKSTIAWMSSSVGGFQPPFRMPHTESPIYKKVFEVMQAGGNFLVLEVNGKELEKHFDYLLTLPGIRDVIKQLRETGYLFPEKMIYHFAFFNNGYLSFHLHELHPETHEIFKRFAKVFEQTYTRFLDLQNAEAQARESQIQLALERVRARTMAMQHSDELKYAAALLFQQVKLLGAPAYSCGYNIWENNEKVFTSWMSTQDGSDFNAVLNIPLTEDTNFIRYAESKQKGEQFFVLELRGERMQEHYNYLKTIPEFKSWFDYAASMGFPLPETQIHHLANFSHGNLLFITLEPCPDFHSVFKRFAAVFDQTYTRFLDLQKAEEQAREAQIEVALERVRSKAMAMHKSSDLPEAAETVFTELNKLGINALRSGFVLLTNDSRRAKLYPAATLLNRGAHSVTGEFEFIGHPIFEKQYESWHKQENYFPVLEDEVLNSYYKILSKELSVPLENFQIDKKQYGSFLPFTEGFLFTWSIEPHSQEQINILNRFKKILDLTTRRYLDLQKAEAQTREAQIEAGLERVRSRTLAMHSSNELAETAAVVFKQLMLLGIAPNRLYIAIMKDENANAEFWLTDEDGSKVSSAFSANLIADNYSLKKMYDGWIEKKKSITIDMVGKELEDYFLYLRSINVPFKGGLSQQHRLQTIAYFSKGFIGIASPQTQPDETTQLLERFASVFNLTFTRFNDLQIAEEQARKAVIEEQKLREEKKRADSLLLNILPEQIANELKEFGKSYARKHENVTILFADIKGFSSIAESLSAEELVTQLDECFRAFDKIVDKHGLEKIKTVGDAYVCACGLPNPVEDHAAKTLAAAIDMLEFIRGFGMTKRIQDLPAFEFRIGIHTGPVVTGVVGLKKFTYDLWGDAVNLAARMEQHGEAGKINISGRTYELVKDKFKCIHRGKVEAKNKGEIDMYFVEGVV